jgi:hypothetical protein
MKIVRAKLLNLLGARLPEELALPFRLGVWGVEQRGDIQLAVTPAAAIALTPTDRVMLALAGEETQAWVNAALSRGPGQVIFHLAPDGRVKLHPVPAAVEAG